jgi:hypothetical protein
MKLRSFTCFAAVALLLSACGSRKPLRDDAGSDGRPAEPDGATDRDGPAGPDGPTDSAGDVGADRASDPVPRDADPDADRTPDVAPDRSGDRDAPADAAPVTDAAADGTGSDGACGSPTDPRNCGACGHDCTALSLVRADKIECRGGACFIPTDGCLPGYGYCSGAVESGCQSDITQAYRCGCGVTCPAAKPSCATPAAGPPMCVASCDGTGLTACGRQQCVDLQTNSSHCGACDARCDAFAGDAICIAGKCAVARCERGFAACDPAVPMCQTILGTFYDCGSCRDSCAVGRANGICVAAACTRVCDRGYGDCDTSNPDCEAPLDTAASCGACGVVCPNDRPLCGGSLGREICLAACAAPTSDVCGTSCTDLQSDPRHCGACDTVCDSFQVCERGKCSPRYVMTDVLSSPDEAQIMFAAIAPDGSYVLGGYFSGPIDLNPGPGRDSHTPADRLDMFIVKFSASGSYAWGHTWQTGNNLPGGLTVAADGSIIATGTFSGTVDFDPGPGVASLSAPRGTPFVLKLNASGGFSWVRSFPITDEDSAYGLASGLTVSADGSLYTVGGFGGQIDLDPGATTDLHRTTSAYSTSLYVVKLTSSGAFVWGRAFGDQTYAWAEPVAVNGSGPIWIGGAFRGTIDLDPGPGTDVHTAVGASDGFLVRWDSDGNYRDGRVFGWGDDDGVTDISFDSDGSAYVGGATVDGATAATIQTDFIQKLSVTGEPLWLRRRPAMSHATAAPGGGLLFAGAGQSEPGAQKMLVTKLDREGKMAWSIPAPGNSSYLSLAFAADATKLVVGGSTDGSAFDLDPGSGTAFVRMPGALITRYAF